MLTLTRIARAVPPFALFMKRTAALPEIAKCKTIAQKGKLMGKLYREMPAAAKAKLQKEAAAAPSFQRKLANPRTNAFKAFCAAKLKTAKGATPQAKMQAVIRMYNDANKLPQLTKRGAKSYKKLLAMRKLKLKARKAKEQAKAPKSLKPKAKAPKSKKAAKTTSKKAAKTTSKKAAKTKSKK